MHGLNQTTSPVINGTLADRRDDSREEVFLPTVVTAGRQTLLKAELVNISCTGFLVRIQGQFERRDRVRLALPVLGDLPAEVMWSMAGCAGCRFIYEIDRRDFSQLLAAISQAANGWLDEHPALQTLPRA